MAPPESQTIGPDLTTTEFRGKKISIYRSVYAKILLKVDVDYKYVVKYVHSKTDTRPF